MNNLTLTIDYDSDPLNPRTEHCNLGTVAAFHKRYNFDESSLTLEQAQALTEDQNYLTLPVYMYEHSGITVSTSPFSCSWDSGQLGIIYTERKNAQAYLGKSATDEEILNYLDSEIKTWASYLEGDVYCWSISKDGEVIDACGGYIGEKDYCRLEGERMLEHCTDEFAQKALAAQQNLNLAYAGL